MERGAAHRSGAADGAGTARRSGAAPEGIAPETLTDRVATIAADRKALDVRVLDVREMVSYTDYFVVCSGNTDRQTRAIHDAVRKEMKDTHGLLPARVEGDREARWILMDYLDCVVHIFTPDTRSYYRLEQLWGEAPGRTVE
jgi:ribosome-associated protein